MNSLMKEMNDDGKDGQLVGAKKRPKTNRAGIYQEYRTSEEAAESLDRLQTGGSMASGRR